MAARALWLMLAVGCYDPTIPAGAPCGERGACPTGLSCYGGRCLAAPELDAAIDSAPVTCAGIPEGAPCDDRSICTSTSICKAGICVGAPQGPCTVADSITEFATTQDANRWRYGMWQAAIDTDGTYAYATDFEAAAYIDFAWRPSDYAVVFSWAQTTPNGGHPDSDLRMIPIRRWVSDVQGLARFTMFHRKSDTSGGDGTRAIVLIDGLQVWMHDVDGTDGIGVVESVEVELQIGMKVDFLLDPLADDGQDTTEHGLTITSR